MISSGFFMESPNQIMLPAMSKNWTQVIIMVTTCQKVAYTHRTTLAMGYNVETGSIHMRKSATPITSWYHIFRPHTICVLKIHRATLACKHRYYTIFSLNICWIQEWKKLRTKKKPQCGSKYFHFTQGICLFQEKLCPYRQAKGRDYWIAHFCLVKYEKIIKVKIWTNEIKQMESWESKNVISLIISMNVFITISSFNSWKNWDMAIYEITGPCFMTYMNKGMIVVLWGTLESIIMMKYPYMYHKWIKVDN